MADCDLPVPPRNPQEFIESAGNVPQALLNQLDRRRPGSPMSEIRYYMVYSRTCETILCLIPSGRTYTNVGTAGPVPTLQFCVFLNIDALLLSLGYNHQ